MVLGIWRHPSQLEASKCYSKKGKEEDPGNSRPVSLGFKEGLLHQYELVPFLV